MELECDISHAFDLFTVNELLESWLPEKAEVEPKVGGKYEVVPAETAGKVRERYPEALLVLNEPREVDPDDPYAEFPIPDDYEW